MKWIKDLKVGDEVSIEWENNPGDIMTGEVIVIVDKTLEVKFRGVSAYGKFYLKDGKSLSDCSRLIKGEKDRN